MNKQSKLLNQLFTAAKTGDITALKKLAAQGVPLDIRQKETGFSPCLVAAGLGQVEALAFLVENGVNVNEVTARGTSTLMLAAAQGHISMVNWLLNNGADITLKNESNDTVLSYALQLFEGPERVLNDIVKFLLAHGVELENRETELGFTPLMLASHKGYSSIVKLLVAHGADVNAASARQKNDSKQTGGKNSPGDNTKRGFPIELITVSVPETPLTLAKTPEIRAYLKEHGAKE